MLIAVSLAACKDGARGGAGVGQPCGADADCARPLTCAAGVCGLPSALQACAPNARRCSGNDAMACDAAGLRETLAASCPNGCHDGQCIEPACAPGARRCGSAGVEQCLTSASSSRWTQTEACPAGCDPASTACKALVCKPLETRCNPNLQVCSGGSRWIDQPCAAGAACRQGQCVAQRCAPNQLSCDGSVLVQCDAAGSGFSSQTQCPAGCSNGACVTPVCAGGATRCTADQGAVESCRPDGSGWSFAQPCSAAGCTPLAPGRAACAQPVCAPLARRCNAASDGVEICLGDGAGWTAGLSCGPDGCSAGACLPPSAGCSAGALRCAGNAVQKCDGTSWSVVAECLTGCSSGACAGASCAPGFTLRAALPAPAPADGVSTILVTGGPLFDAAGAPLADGTPVNLAVTGGAQLVAPEAQVRTLRGLVDFAVRAPSAPGTVAASATVLGSTFCAATTQLTFVAPAASAYSAEDFTTDAARDFAQTSAQWQTALGQAIATGSDLGDGRDGAFTAPAGSWDLTARVRPGGTAPFAPVLRVTSVGSQAVTVEGAYADAFQPGDEALLLELQGAGAGATAAAGAWESLTVAQSASGQIAFTTPVLGVYGELPGGPLSGQKVVLQRVPHFTDLTVPAGAALTAAAWDGQKGGAIAFRVSGTAAIAGAVQADALGFRGGVAPDATHGQAGESIGGMAPAIAGWASPAFGGGSGGYLCGDPYHLTLLDSWFGSGGSYGSAGGSTCSGGQGGSYGAASLSRIFHGSGSGSQEQSTHQDCNAGTCPSESLASHGAASASSDRSSTVGNWSDTSAYCPQEIVGHAGPQALPCGNDATCNDVIYGSCAPYNRFHSDGKAPSDCSASCPGLVVPNQHGGQCGGGFACYGGTCAAANAGTNGLWCDNSAFQCNFDNNTGFWSSCGGCNNSDDYCRNCSWATNYCDCYRRCYSCYPVCSTCAGCVTNPGCSTDVGCQTCTGPAGSCDMTRGGSDCAQKCPLAWQVKAAGGRGGGIVFVAAGALDLSGGGTITARGGAPEGGNFGGSGGSIFLKLGRLKLAASGVQLDASGAAGGGAGRVRIDRGAGDDPVARAQVSPSPYTAAFAPPQVQSRALALPSGKSATSVKLVQALGSGAAAYFISSDAGATWKPIAAGGTVSFAPSADVRWRAQLTPLFRAPASVAALSLVLTLQ